MAEKLSDEKVDKILTTYKKTKSINETSQKVGVSKPTVKKYVDRHIKDNDDDGDGGTPDTKSNGDSAVVEMSGSDSQLADLTDEELMNMSESEFIETFFSEFDNMGIKTSFVEMVSNQAQIRGQIPDEDQMSQRIQSHSSGVGNANDANAIAELYWALAQRYLRSRGLSPGGSQSGGMMSMGGGMGGSGDWVSAPNGQQNGSGQRGGQAPDEGDWVSTGASPGQQPSGQQPRQPQQGQQQNQQMTQFAQMMRQMQQQQQAMMEQVMQQQQQSEKEALEKKIEELEHQLSTDSSDSPADSLQEFVELKETLDKINDDGGSDERMEQVVGTLQQQLQGIQQQIADDDSGAEMGQLMANSDGQMGALLALAQSGDVDAQEMVQLAQQLGEVESDPEVAAKKYEKEIEEMRVEAEQEKWQSIMQGVEQLTETAGETLAGAVGGAVSGGGDNEAEAEAEPEVQTAEPEVEVSETGGQAAQSPAQELVQQASDSDDPEPEKDEITPDSVGGDVVEPGEGDTGEDVDPEVVEEPEISSQPDPEAETAKPDGGEEEVVCPGCGREDFDDERQLGGHEAHYDEWD